jgi:hypothetical protein
MLVWKNQNPWTALRGSFYDYYLDCNGGYFGYKHAAAPIHIQLNLNDSSICVLNQTAMDVFGAKATVELFDLHGRLLSRHKHIVNITSGKVDTTIKKLHFEKYLCPPIAIGERRLTYR